MPKLELINDNNELSGVKFTFSEYPTLIGREDTDIMFEDLDLSPIHAAVWIDKRSDKIVVRGLTIKSPTTINGEKIPAHQDILVEDDSTIIMGNTKFKIVS